MKLHHKQYKQADKNQKNELLIYREQKQNSIIDNRQKLIFFEKSGLDEGLQKKTDHIEDQFEKELQQQNQKKQFLINDETEKYYKIGLTKNYSFSRKLVPSVSQQQITSKVQSPKVQGNWMEFLWQQNEKLFEENQKKQKIINQLLEFQDNSQKISKVSSPRLQQLTSLQPPKSVETKKVTLQVSKLPQIHTPKPNLKNRIETNETAQTLDESPTLYKCFSPREINQQNWSFGKQLYLDEEKIYQKQNQQQQLNSLNIKQFKLTAQKDKFNQKQYSHLTLKIKTNFQKPLLKLPQEFHLQDWNKKKQQLDN
ncbi:unnamed protein product [Paramecium sonneborni]|uniref:Uncharacterized protein n=1 Tax=Paramecium sonneborni TaxID=65129 RepID=A0A8S1KTP8_9CILI|nr:unnamed protein product [Paramecium sonneborni]